MDSDPDIEFIEKDSGMSSLGGSKDETPERRAVIVRIEHIVDIFPWRCHFGNGQPIDWFFKTKIH